MNAQIRRGACSPHAVEWSPHIARRVISEEWSQNEIMSHSVYVHLLRFIESLDEHVTTFFKYLYYLCSCGSAVALLRSPDHDVFASKALKRFEYE